MLPHTTVNCTRKSPLPSQSSLPLAGEERTCQAFPDLPNLLPAGGVSVENSFQQPSSQLSVDTLAAPQEQCGLVRSLSQNDHFSSYDDTSTPLSIASTPTTFCSTGQVSFAVRDGTGLGHQVAMANHSRAREKDINALVSFASDALVNDMVLNSGWRHSETSNLKNRVLWKDQIVESFNLACVTLNRDQTVFSDDDDECIEKRIVQSLSTFRSKMAKVAETYGREYLQNFLSSMTEQLEAPDYAGMQAYVKEITDPSVPNIFFLHKQGVNGTERVFGHPILEKFHLHFWYDHDTSPVMKFRSSYHTTPTSMLAFSGIALRCALDRVAQGRCSNQGNTLKFSTGSYAARFKHYHTAIVGTLEDEHNGPIFRAYLDSLNAQGMERVRRSGRAGSFPILQPFVIPRMVMATVSASPDTDPGPSSAPIPPWPDSYFLPSAATADAGPSVPYIPQPPAEGSDFEYFPQLPY